GLEAEGPLPLSAADEPRPPLSPAVPVASREAEALPRPEAFEASCALGPGEEPAGWPDGVAPFTGKPAAVKFASTPPPGGIAIQMRNLAVAVPAATALERGPFDAPRHHTRKARNVASTRVMCDVRSPTSTPVGQSHPPCEPTPNTVLLTEPPFRRVTSPSH